MNLKLNAFAERRACRRRCITRHLSNRLVDESTAVRCESGYARTGHGCRKNGKTGQSVNDAIRARVHIAYSIATSEVRVDDDHIVSFFVFVICVHVTHKTKSKNTVCAYMLSRRHVFFPSGNVCSGFGTTCRKKRAIANFFFTPIFFNRL